MFEYRVEVAGEEAFNPREWLRRDVLWASLMSPYDQQMKGWTDGSQLAQHQGNTNRQAIYSREEDTEHQAIAFFNQGKNIAGLVTSVALFKAYGQGFGAGEPVNLLEVQSQSIDKTLLAAPRYTNEKSPDEKFVYEACSTAVESNMHESYDSFRAQHRYNLAGARMLGLAAREAAHWLEIASDTSLPAITINNGAHPRSVGPRVDMLQPIFEDTVASTHYQQLSETATTNR